MNNDYRTAQQVHRHQSLRTDNDDTNSVELDGIYRKPQRRTQMEQSITEEDDDANSDREAVYVNPTHINRRPVPMPPVTSDAYLDAGQVRKVDAQRREQRRAQFDDTPDEYSPMVQVRQRDADRKNRKYKAWHDLGVRESLLTIATLSGLSWVFVLILFVFVYCIYGYPLLPIVGRTDGFPSFGLIFLIPWFLRILLGWAAEGAVSLIAISIFKWISLGYMILNAYNLTIIITWLVMYYTYLLPTAARAHASPAGTFTLFIILGIVFLFDVYLWTSHSRVETTVPRRLEVLGRKKGLSDAEIAKEVSTL